MRAVVLAGGKGSRLLPYTVAIPKPLVPIGEIPIIDIILTQLKRFGFTEVTISVGHLAAVVMAYLGTGDRYGLTLSYVHESFPLGTAGPLTLIDDLPEHFLLLNGDVLTDLDMSKFLEWHIAQGVDISISGYRKKVSIDLGVLKSVDSRLTDYVEKPEEWFDVSMGLYAMSRSVLEHIPRNTRFDFPDLIQAHLRIRRPVAVYPFDGLWLDIGRPADYEESQRTFAAARDRLLPESLG